MSRSLRLLAVTVIGVLAHVSPAIGQCPVACGDCDRDGDVDVLDALEVGRIVNGVRAVPGAQDFVCCDTDADGRITLLDSLIIAQIAGMTGAMPTCATLLPPPEIPGAVQLCVDTPSVGAGPWRFRLDSTDPVTRTPLGISVTTSGVAGSPAQVAARWRDAINATGPLPNASGPYCYRAYQGQPGNCFVVALADCSTDAIVPIPSPDPATPRITNPASGCAIPPSDRCAYTADLIADSDGDAVVESTDNCVDIVNAGQQDSNRNGIGDVCDSCPLFPSTVYARGSCAVDPTISCLTAANCPTGGCERGAFEWRTAIDYKYVIGDFVRSPDVGTYVFNPPDVDGIGSRVPLLQSAPLDAGLWFLLRSRTCPGGSTWQTAPLAEPGRAVLP